jgi:hypothetical protein
MNYEAPRPQEVGEVKHAKQQASKQASKSKQERPQLKKQPGGRTRGLEIYRWDDRRAGGQHTHKAAITSSAVKRRKRTAPAPRETRNTRANAPAPDMRQVHAGKQGPRRQSSLTACAIALVAYALTRMRTHLGLGRAVTRHSPALDMHVLSAIHCVLSATCCWAGVIATQLQASGSAVTPARPPGRSPSTSASKKP